jgi:hypothetical protein
LAERIQTVWLTLDASSDGSASEIEAINLRLAKMTQKLLKEMRGLKTIEWRGVPGPDEECLRVFAGLERLEKFVIDCVETVDGGQMSRDDLYKYLEYVFHFSWSSGLIQLGIDMYRIGQFLRILGPNLKSLHLDYLHHDVFRHHLREL